MGLAGTSILLWIFFALRRRRRTRRLEHDTAVSATLAAAGFHRTPLDDDDDPAAGSANGRSSAMAVGGALVDPFAYQDQMQELNHRSSSGLASVNNGNRTSSAAFLPDEYNPYSDYVVPGGSRDGYISGSGAGGYAYDALPVGAAAAGMGAAVLRDRGGSSSSGIVDNMPGMMNPGAASASNLGHGHNPSNSGSFEPLLASYYRQNSDGTTPPSPVPVVPPQIAKPTDNSFVNPSATSSVYSMESLARLNNNGIPTNKNNSGPLEDDAEGGGGGTMMGEDTRDYRLDPRVGLRRLNTDRSELRDEEDYSRRVLGVSFFGWYLSDGADDFYQVRNLPDAASQISQRID